jgi:hypothetical protein
MRGADAVVESCATGGDAETAIEVFMVNGRRMEYEY